MSCFLSSKDKTASFVIAPAHDMEFWAIKMLILSQFYLFISSLLGFLFYATFSSRSNWENHSCNFLKFCQSAINMMRICLLWASANIILLRKLVIHVKFSGHMSQHICKLGSIHATELSNLVLKMVILTFSGNSHFWLPLHLSFQNVCKVK